MNFCLYLPFLFVWLLVALLALSPWMVAGTLVPLTVQVESLPAGLSEGPQRVANALCVMPAGHRRPGASVVRMYCFPLGVARRWRLGPLGARVPVCGPPQLRKGTASSLHPAAVRLSTVPFRGGVACVSQAE